MTYNIERQPRECSVEFLNWRQDETRKTGEVEASEGVVTNY